MSEPTDTEGAIHRLPQDVVNKIAAGEVVQRPCHAVKELLENAIDAHATTIQVAARNGGTKLSVTDNGDGVRLADMRLLCQRHTTSKLRAYSDLRSISTFGFRGEALASITYVARVKVVTRRRGMKSAYAASYVDGAMKEPAPALVAANEGTTVYVDDLFHSLPVRRAALRSPATEYARIVDVVRRYAVRYPHIGFVCRKDASAPPDVATGATTTHTTAKTKSVIEALYGKDLCGHLLHFAGTVGGGDGDGDGGSADVSCTIDAFFSDTDYHQRRGTGVYFVNGRLVDCAALHKAIFQAYTAHLGKGKAPFAYVSLTVPSEEVDVNVHPTKAEVALLHEDAICGFIHKKVAEQLAGEKARSKPFQVVLPAPPPPPAPKKHVADTTPPPTPGTPTPQRIFIDGTMALHTSEVDLTIKRGSPPRKRKRDDHAKDDAELPQHPACAAALRRARAECHTTLRRVLREGAVIGRLQADHGARGLLLEALQDVWTVDVNALITEVAYQAFLTVVGGAPHDIAGATSAAHTVTFTTPPAVSDLCRLALDIPGVWYEADGAKEAICSALVDRLVEHRTVLQRFGVDVTEEGKVAALPRLWDAFMPPMAALPLVLLRLGSETPWEAGDESEAVHRSIAHELSSLFVPLEHIAVEGEGGSSVLLAPSSPEVLLEEHVLPFARSDHFAPPQRFATDGVVVKVATSQSLCTVFERSHCQPHSDVLPAALK